MAVQVQQTQRGGLGINENPANSEYVGVYKLHLQIKVYILRHTLGFETISVRYQSLFLFRASSCLRQQVSGTVPGSNWDRAA